jgi:DNA-binding winged helix-turn-helix (wHTH) protein
MPLYCRDLSLMIDPLGQSVWTSKGRKRLAPTALAVLFYLAAARGAALSRDRLRVLVWPEGGGPRRYGQLLEYYLSQVRKALRAWRLPLKLRVIKDFGHALERFPADT